MASRVPARPARLLAATGDPMQPRVMSGLPFHFHLYGTRAGVIDGTITQSPDPRRLRYERFAWNGWRIATGRSYGGHQYTRRRNEWCWRDLPVEPATVINIFQLYPQRVLSAGHIRRWYFIDQTLTQLFDAYGQSEQLSRGVVARTVAWERAGYECADHLIVNSNWAKASLVDDYGVDPQRISIVLQAANFDVDAYEEWAVAGQPDDEDPDAPLRLVFVGNDWRRKGLDRLIAALSRVNAGSVRCTLDVVGMRRDDVPRAMRDVAQVRWHGFIDKQHDQRRFLELVSSAHVGCLLSRAEAGGNCLREYHALGLAVLGTTAGGAADQTLADASWLVDVAEPVDEIADRLRWLAADRQEVQRRRAESWRRRKEVLWPATLAGVDEQLSDRGC